MPITAFLEALGEKPVKAYEDLKLYYAPNRDDSEPMFAVDTQSNRWYDHATNETANLMELAALIVRGDHRNDIPGYIVKMMNENEIAKEVLTKHAIDPIVIHLDVAKIPLTDFMKALGQGHPMAANGDLRIYNSPYDSSAKGTMVINVKTNLWRDTKSGVNGGIYDLAYELTGTQADALLRKDLRKFISLYKNMKPADAILLGTLAHNIGPGAVDKSTVYKNLKSGDRNIYKAYTSHCRYKGKWHKGLYQRRCTEILALFIP